MSDDDSEVLSMSMQEELLRARRLKDENRALEARLVEQEHEIADLRAAVEHANLQAKASQDVLADTLSKCFEILDMAEAPAGSEGTQTSPVRLIERLQQLLTEWRPTGNKEIGPTTAEGLLEEAQDLAMAWTYPDRAHMEIQGTANWLMLLSTGGASENEELIGNTTRMFESLCWQASWRGGKHAYGRGDLAEKFIDGLMAVATPDEHGIQIAGDAEPGYHEDHHCLEGSQKIPEHYEPCCATFESHTKACVYDLRYEYSSLSGWGIALADDVGGGKIEISFCPHCGSPLGKPDA